jgi:hypothetical protein
MPSADPGPEAETTIPTSMFAFAFEVQTVTLAKTTARQQPASF